MMIANAFGPHPAELMGNNAFLEIRAFHGFDFSEGKYFTRGKKKFLDSWKKFRVREAQHLSM